MPVAHFCFSCSKTFATLSGLRSHARATMHVANPFVCDSCEVSFPSLMALDSHMNSSRHAYDYYSTPPPVYYGRDDNDGAFYDSQGDVDPYCNGCERPFIDMVALNQHLFHSLRHNWCFECSRDFRSPTALSQHQNSLAHRGRDFKCPFCLGMFKSPSGVALHIESGCHRVTRQQVTAAVQALNIVPNLSIKRITGPVCPSAVRTAYIASEASFNGSAYECYLCPKLFRTLSGLNSHLNSPAHDEEEFRCPQCRAEFKLISGFVQHVESQSCSLARTTQIDDYFNDLTGQFSRLLML